MNRLDVYSSYPAPTVAAGLITPSTTQTLGDTSHVFELASVTKLLAAYGFLIACEEGAFELDDPCGPATVRHMLAHASGVGFRREDRVREPEERRVYSSYGFELLASKLVDATDIDCADYLSQAVFEPLGMKDTTLWGSPGHEARSTVADMMAFAQELLEPTLVHPDTLAEAFSEQFAGLDGVVPGYGMHKPCPWGLGFEIKGEKQPHWTGPSMPPETVGHFGQSGTFLWLVPEAKTAAVMLSDRDFGSWAKPLWADANEKLWQSL